MSQRPPGRAPTCLLFMFMFIHNTIVETDKENKQENNNNNMTINKKNLAIDFQYSHCHSRLTIINMFTNITCVNVTNVNTT